jgi:hypothetical protein
MIVKDVLQIFRTMENYPLRIRVVAKGARFQRTSIPSIDLIVGDDHRIADIGLFDDGRHLHFALLRIRVMNIFQRDCTDPKVQGKTLYVIYALRRLIDHDVESKFRFFLRLISNLKNFRSII